MHLGHGRTRQAAKQLACMAALNMLLESCEWHSRRQGAKPAGMPVSAEQCQAEDGEPPRQRHSNRRRKRRKPQAALQESNVLIGRAQACRRPLRLQTGLCTSWTRRMMVSHPPFLPPGRLPLSAWPTPLLTCKASAVAAALQDGRMRAAAVVSACGRAEEAALWVRSRTPGRFQPREAPHG